MASTKDRAVAVVTDSTAYLPAALVERSGVHVVPLSVTIAGRSAREGLDVTPAQVAAALRARRIDVHTSRPAPEEFRVMFDALLAQGAVGVVSVHLSGKLSGTYDSARSAAAGLVGTVSVVDSGSAGMGVGFAVLAAAEAAAEGGSVEQVRSAADLAARHTATLFCVDTLEFLRRGGRIGAAAAVLGTALAVKPILHVAAGEVVVREKVRTGSRALARLVDLAVEEARDGPVDAAVHHCDAPDRAADLAERLRSRLPRLRHLYLAEVGAAVAAHVGPGFSGIVIARLSTTIPAVHRS